MEGTGQLDEVLMCLPRRFGYTCGMRRVLATLAAVGALLFGAGSD